MTLAFAKSPKFLGGGAAILVALVVGFFLFRGPKSTPSTPTNKTVTVEVASPPPVQVASKPSPFGPVAMPSVVEPTTKADKPEAKSSPPPKVSVSKPKASRPPAVSQRQVVVTRQQFYDELLQKLVDQGITVHLIDETPSPSGTGGAESTAPAEEERPITDREREQEFKEQIRKGRLP